MINVFSRPSSALGSLCHALFKNILGNYHVFTKQKFISKRKQLLTTKKTLARVVNGALCKLCTVAHFG